MWRRTTYCLIRTVSLNVCIKMSDRRRCDCRSCRRDADCSRECTRGRSSRTRERTRPPARTCTHVGDPHSRGPPFRGRRPRSRTRKLEISTIWPRRVVGALRPNGKQKNGGGGAHAPNFPICAAGPTPNGIILTLNGTAIEPTANCTYACAPASVAPARNSSSSIGTCTNNSSSGNSIIGNNSGHSGGSGRGILLANA